MWWDSTLLGPHLYIIQASNVHLWKRFLMAGYKQYANPLSCSFCCTKWHRWVAVFYDKNDIQGQNLSWCKSA